MLGAVGLGKFASKFPHTHKQTGDHFLSAKRPLYIICLQVRLSVKNIAFRYFQYKDLRTPPPSP